MAPRERPGICQPTAHQHQMGLPPTIGRSERKAQDELLSPQNVSARPNGKRIQKQTKNRGGARRRRAKRKITAAGSAIVGRGKFGRGEKGVVDPHAKLDARQPTDPPRVGPFGRGQGPVFSGQRGRGRRPGAGDEGALEWLGTSRDSASTSLVGLPGFDAPSPSPKMISVV
jgi:hypothetical protein